MPYISGVEAGTWPELLKHWWQWVLVCLCLASVLLGLGHILFVLLSRLWVYLRHKKPSSTVAHAKVLVHLQKYTSTRPQWMLEDHEKKKPTSLGIYLGSFDQPISPSQLRMLSRHDIIILDPYQGNVITSLALLHKFIDHPSDIIGRLDLEAFPSARVPTHDSEGFFIRFFDQILNVALRPFRELEGSNRFAGILLAGWEMFPVPILDEFTNVLYAMGLDVYLEISAPRFLEESTTLARKTIAGVVIRNSLLQQTGERRDCFDLEAMRTTVKSFVSQSCLRDFTVLVWETLDDNVVVPNALVKRTFTWCNFYSALLWIGTREALFDTTVEAIPAEPLSAFDWLKEPQVLELHALWRNKRVIPKPDYHPSISEQLDEIFPSLEDTRLDCSCKHTEETSASQQLEQSYAEAAERLVDLRDILPGDPSSVSPSDDTYNEIGCFPVGIDVSFDDFQEIVFSQRNLRKLELVDVVRPSALRNYGLTFGDFIISSDISFESPNISTPTIQEAIRDLALALKASPDDGSGGIRVFLGLHSGFQRNAEKQFWGVYHCHDTGILDIYISKNVDDLMGTILHTFLSSRGFARRHCFAAEIEFSRWNGTLISASGIPPRVIQDIELSSPDDCLFLLHQISLALKPDNDSFLGGLKSAIFERLIDTPSWDQLKTVNTIGYLSGDVSMEALLESRLQWHCQSKRRHPSLNAAISLFEEVQEKLPKILMCRNQSDLQTIIDSLGRLLEYSEFNAVGDIFALSIFCVIRKLALEEVYIEVTDRNPLFNDQPDQAAAFSELFALGSRCEAYFDISPSQFGELLSKMYRTYYSIPEHQPPVFEESQGAHTSAYAEAQIDVDSNYKPTEMPAYKRFTFLSVFAIPALIDILMLTMTGHGMYLSSSGYMTFVEQHSATTALMISLLLSGAIGTWITCCGTYYLTSMAFSAMNYFVITRLLGGFAFTLIVGLIGFIAFACTISAYAGLIFFLYLVVLTSYLCLLAALANYQFMGSSFLSGRAVIICCIPVLFASPLTTIFVPHHDIIIYLTVLYVFVAFLLLGVRWTGSRWTTWYQQIKIVTDVELRDWYIGKQGPSSKETIENMSDPAVLKLARENMLDEILAEQRKWMFSSRTKDPLVAKLVKSFESTSFLMDWYCRISGVSRPILFSSAWNVQTKVALFSMQRSQLGIRFHNAFLHWRQAGDEIGCTVLYFVLALLDKWISLIEGGKLVGLTSSDANLTMPVGFGLAYYLIGAVLLDFNGYKLHELASKNVEEAVPNDSDIAHAVKVKADNRRKLYWTTLARYMTWHVWGLAVTSTLLWLFSTSTKPSAATTDPPKLPPYGGTLIFLSYIAAYTGLLWYQYTKIFSGPHALRPLIIGVSIGLIVGFVLDHELPGFVYSEIIALGIATWTVALLSLWASKIIRPPEDLPRPQKQAGRQFKAYSVSGADQAWSHAELQSLVIQFSGLPEKERLPIDPEYEFGSQVKLTLGQWRHIKLSRLSERAFPDAEELLNLTMKIFRERLVMVELIPDSYFSRYGQSLRAVSSSNDVSLRLQIACDAKRIARNRDPIQGFYWDVAQLLIQVIAEMYLGYTTHDAVLVSDLWINNAVWNNDLAHSNIIERQRFASNSSKTSDSIIILRKQIVRSLCLGIDCDIEWDGLPEHARKYLAGRCAETSHPLNHAHVLFWNSKLKETSGLDFDTHIARCDYAISSIALALNRIRSSTDVEYPGLSYLGLPHKQSNLLDEHRSLKSVRSVADLLKRASPPKYSIRDKTVHFFGIMYHLAGTACKFLAIAFIADPEYQRELNCTLSPAPVVLKSSASFIALSIWMWAKTFQTALLPVFLVYRRKDVVAVWKNIQGMEISIKRRRIVIRNLEGVSTGFIHLVDAETFKLVQYRGNHDIEPTTDDKLCSVNTYSKNMSLLRHMEVDHGKNINTYVYKYQPDHAMSRRISRVDFLTSPITRRCVAGQNVLQDVSYNAKGQIDSGSYMKDGNMVRFQYHYQKADRHGGALLRAEFALQHLTCSVSWCAPPRRKPERLHSWIPHSQVTEATFVVGPDVWESKFFYDHKFHPTIVTTLNGQKVDTPALILYDYLDVLKKPRHVSFLDDNPLYGFRSITSNPLTRWLGFNTRRYPVSTSQARTSLWKAWKNDFAFDGVIVRWLDERLLRREPILRPYWRMRDWGRLARAEEYLDKHRDAIIANVDLDNTISGLTPLAIKINDLYSFGQGGDACSRTRSNVTTQVDDKTTLHVIAVDTGTWPNEGGGVSASRSEVVNNLRTINWHMVAETATDVGVAKHQTERNIHSLKIIPLWGLDLLTPTHGLFANRLDSEIEHVTTHITLLDIERNFVPILAALTSGARALDFSMSDVKQVTRALVNLNAYFKDSRHWSAVWSSDVVKSAWRSLWLSQTAANSRPSSQWLKTELPTLGQLDQGLELWSRYLFIFSIPIPEKMPAVFQASHHSVSAAYGVVCKIKRGCTLQIWDHAISWRETNLYLSSVLCPLSPFTRNSLLGLMRVTSVLTLHHADTILPCADFFNPGWETEIGTCQGKIEHRAKFRRKIDPVVNGITHIERFAPVQEIKTKKPTVTMLSHLWYAKDIKTALLAADIIINKWGFKDYNLEVYGALDRSPSYTTDCQEIIATKSLRHNVTLKGEADPIFVLERTWVFLNSSISEGLPLALGEAALTGAPVVCTDVGASARVLTDPLTNACFSAVVAPNSPLFLARAQIKLLALLEEWSHHSDPSASSPSTLDASFPDEVMKNDVERITKRMYEQADARRRLGMKNREIVKASFSGERYLREHEQMLWIGKARKDMTLPIYKRPSARMDTPATVRILDERMKEKIPMPRRSVREREGLNKGMKRGNTSGIGSGSGGMILPSLAFGESTLQASLLTETGPSTTTDVSGDKKQNNKKDTYASVNAGGGRRDSSMVERWMAEIARI